MHLDLASFCELVGQLQRSNAEKALAVLWFHDQLTPDVAMTSGELAKILDGHRVGTANSTALAARIRESKFARESAKGFALKPGSRSIIREWLPTTTTARGTSDLPPDFSGLVSDARMRAILDRRWQECVCCLDQGAPLAAVVMMGGLLESLFVSKQKEFSDKRPLIDAARAPEFCGKKKPIQNWTLNDYIEVGNELGWIGAAAKQVSVVLRNYRNLIHPEVQYAKNVEIESGDARLMWDVTKSIARELLR